MPSRFHVLTTLLLLLAACDPTPVELDGDETTETTASDETTESTGDTETGDPLNPWCCWCDEQGEIRCADATGPGECKALGAALGVDVVETECTGLPILGSLECVDLVCELPSATTTDTGSTDDTSSTDTGPTDPGPLAACCDLEGACDGGPGQVDLICDPVVGGACLVGELVDGCDYVGAAIVCSFTCE